MSAHLLVILFHILFWAQNVARNLYSSEPYSKTEIICDQLLIATLCYINYFLFVPYILRKNNSKYYVLWLFVFVSCFTIIYAIWNFSQPFIFGAQEVKSSLSLWLNIFNLSFLYGAVSTGSKLALDWTVNQKQNQELVLQKTTAQIQLMKSNVNIPFLLKVLDYTENISKDNPGQVEHPIVLISDVLRYGLYESELASTRLAKEIEIIQEYLELQKLINPSINTPLVIEETNQSISVIPNLLLRMISLWRTALDKREQTLDYPIQLQSIKNAVILRLPVGLIATDELKNIANTFTNFSNENFTVQSEHQTDQLQLKISTIVL